MLQALRQAQDLAATPGNIARVAAASSESLARWAFTQCALRKRAKAKFQRAEEMLFDREGLEMASHETVAKYHASRFPKGARVADLTCGVGGDLIAIAARCDAIGYEIDPERADCAQYNLRVLGLKAEIRQENCMQADWDFECAFADPSRRAGGRRRSLRPEEYQPPLTPLLERMRSLRLGCVKLSPLLPDRYLADNARRIEFVSHRGECCEALLYLGREVEVAQCSAPSTVRAVCAESGEALPGSEEALPAASSVPLAFVLVADPAAIRAHALSTLCAKAGAVPLGGSNGFLTSESWASSPNLRRWLRPYATLGSGPADPKRIQAVLKALDAHVAAVKVRGVRENPERWIRTLKRAPARPVILALYPQGSSVRYAVLEAL